jgi:phosphate transport system substrate-binding protein
MTGAGATFPYPIYAKWAEMYKGHRQRPELPVGRLGRRHQADQGQDRRLRRLRHAAEGAELDAAGLLQFPAIMGGVVAVVNLDGVAPGQLKLTGPVWPTSTSARSPSGTRSRSPR